MLFVLLDSRESLYQLPVLRVCGDKTGALRHLKVGEIKAGRYSTTDQSISIRPFQTRAEPMPCGLGQHPYFPCGPETQLDTRVSDAWTIDKDVLPVAKVLADGRYDLRERKVCGQDLDNGFGGWNGEAKLTDPKWPYAVTLSSLEARFFQLYSPKEGGIFVAEPVSHANAALNAPEADWPELGMRVLEPGEQMRLDMRLDVVPV